MSPKIGIHSDKNHMESEQVSYRFKKAILAVGLILLSGHFILIAIHCLPDEYVHPTARAYSYRYVYPVFHQGWGLFAPEPQRKYKRLQFKYASNGQWGEWVHPEDISADAHFKYRMGPMSKLYHVNQAVGFHLWRSKDHFDTQAEEAGEFYRDDMGYSMARHYAQEYAYHFLGLSEIDSIRIQLYIIDPKESETEVVDFPTYVSE